MRKLRFNLWAVLAAMLLVSSVAFTGCKTEDEKEIIYFVATPVVPLSDSDPIANTFTGNFGDAKFASDFAWATSCSCTKLDSIDGLDESAYHTLTAFDWTKYDNVDSYYKKNSEPVYVVYNTFTDADLTDGIQKEEIDKHSGVVIFKAKYSPWGSPTVGCYYGVKFQFLVGEKEVPETRTSTTQYTDFLFIEAGYNAAEAYNTVDSIFDAVLKFNFNNTDYFSNTNWKWDTAGGKITSQAE